MTLSNPEVARASLIQYMPKHLQIRVVVGNAKEWKPPNPELNIFEAYVDRPAGGIEAYLIVIDAQREIKPDDPSTWQGLQGVVIEAFYSPIVELFAPKYFATDSPKVERTNISIPVSILTAAGIERQEAFNVSSLASEYFLSLGDLLFVRNNCSRPSVQEKV